MSEVKRYDTHGDMGMQPDSSGEYVLFADYDLLRHELDAAVQKLATAQEVLALYVNNYKRAEAERDAALSLLREASNSTAHLIHCADPFATEGNGASTEAHNLFYAIDDARGDLDRIDALIKPTTERS